VKCRGNHLTKESVTIMENNGDNLGVNPIHSSFILASIFIFQDFKIVLVSNCFFKWGWFWNVLYIIRIRTEIKKDYSREAQVFWLRYNTKRTWSQEDLLIASLIIYNVLHKIFANEKYLFFTSVDNFPFTFCNLFNLKKTPNNTYASLKTAEIIFIAIKNFIFNKTE